jgi:hypothetical protein
MEPSYPGAIPDLIKGGTAPHRATGTVSAAGDRDASQGQLFGGKRGEHNTDSSASAVEGPKAERRRDRRRTPRGAMYRRAQGMARRKAVYPGVLGPDEATRQVDPRRPRHGPSQPQGGPGAPRTSRRLQDHASSDARRFGSPVRWRSMENPPLLHEQDTLGWAVPGRIRIRCRGSRPKAEGADFFFTLILTGGQQIEGTRKVS